MSINELQKNWRDEPNYHKEVHESFIANVNTTPELKEHRDWVEQFVFGFGERSFHWFWKLLCDEMPQNFSFLEIGVFKAQIVSLIKLLRADAKVFGVTPMDNSGGVWESDYGADIKRIHEQFNLPQPHIFKGSSLDQQIIETVSNLLYDCVYVDGDHTLEGCLSDLNNYAKLVKKGGYLVIDDARSDLNMPFGFFQGIEPVTEATLQYMHENGNDWEFITNVVHLRIYKRK